MRPGEGADVVGAAAATAAAAASVFSGANTSTSGSGGVHLAGANSGTGVGGIVSGDLGSVGGVGSGGGLIQRTHSDAVVGLTPHASPAANAAATPVSTLLLVAASPFPSRPLGQPQVQAQAQAQTQGQEVSSLYHLSESATDSPMSRLVEDEATMMAALSSALHADAEEERQLLAAQQSQALAQRQQVLTQAMQPTPAQRRVPTLPPAQIKSLVRSHVRHVGLSARLKTRTQVRELRDALAEERKTRALQAAQNIFLPPPADAAAASTTAAPASGSSAARLGRRRRALPSQSSASHSQQRSSRVAARNSSLSMLTRLGLSEEDAHLLPQPLVSESSSAAATAAPAASATTASAPPIVVPWPSWMPPGLSAASLAVSAAASSSAGVNFLSSAPLGESKEEDSSHSQASGSAWRDQHGSVIGMESTGVPTPAAAGSAASTSRFPAIPSLPLQLASSAPSLALALSPRMPPIAATAATAGVVGAGGTSSRDQAKQRSARLLKGSFAPTVS